MPVDKKTKDEIHELASDVVRTTMQATLGHVLVVIDSIIAEPVRRDGGPPKHVRIRNAIAAMIDERN